MAEQGLAIREVVSIKTAKGTVEMDIQGARTMLQLGAATDAEVYGFLKLCQYQELNPFLREAYLIKYDEKAPASVVVGKDTFVKRAASHPDFDGYEAGVIVQRAAQVIEAKLPLPGDILIGGYCKVFHKRRHVPFEVQVSFKEYNTQRSNWRRMPATMIRKVALVQALREAFPDVFEALYDEAEMDSVISYAETIDVAGRSVGSMAEPTEDQDPNDIYQVCPLHNTPWEEGRYGREHAIGEKLHACHLKDALNQLLRNRMSVLVDNEDAIESVDHARVALNEVLKQRFGQTWSALIKKRQPDDAIETIKLLDHSWTAFIEGEIPVPVEVGDGEPLDDGAEAEDESDPWAGQDEPGEGSEGEEIEDGGESPSGTSQGKMGGLA
jgi:phage recombination protein Bet